MANENTAQATPEAAKTAPETTPVTTTPASTTPVAGTQKTTPESKTALQYHEEAEAAVEAYDKETDAAKKAELKKTATELLTKTKESYKAEKEAAEKALAESKPGKAPDKYDLKLPEKTLLNQANLDEIVAYAKAQGLSNEQAQAHVERESAAISKDRENQKAEFVKMNNGWLEELKADKVLGGDKLGENDEKAARVLDAFGTPEFKKELTDSGLGRHPGLFRMLVKIAGAMGEDNFIAAGAQAAEKEKSRADRFYGGTNPQQQA